MNKILLPLAETSSLTSGAFTSLRSWRVAVRCALLAGCVAFANHVTAQTADNFDPEPDGSVSAIAVQADGSVYLGGSFSTVAGQTRTNLVRLLSDGTLDTNYVRGADGTVNALAIQTDGKLLVAGSFATLGGSARPNLGRLNADSSVDTAFNPKPNDTVYCLAQQADGKLLIAGNFTQLGTASRNHLARLNSNGSLDNAFNPGTDGAVWTLALQSDGSILVGGDFSQIGGVSSPHLARLNPNGAVDTNFVATVDGSVYALAVQPDGSILVGGSFTYLDGQFCLNLGRVYSDGSQDLAFNPSPDSTVNSIALQADGSILVGGSFSALSGAQSLYLGRLSSDGSFDGLFNASADNTVNALALQADGNILVGGNFGTLANQTRSYVGRVVNTTGAFDGLSFADGTVLWFRDGSAPEIWRTTFETTTDGTNWTSLGAGYQFPGGWELDNVNASTNYPLRARGFLSAAANNGSDYFVQDLLGSGPQFVTQPRNTTNGATTTANFSVQLSGTLPLSYHWRKGSTNLVNNAKVSGALSPTLTISNVLSSDAGQYSIVVTNLFGAVTSIVANLTVLDPAFQSPPVSRTNLAGTVATFTVSGIGTQPFAFQWRKGTTNLADGGNISGSKTATLTISNVLGADAGVYSLQLVNPAGSITTPGASLVVIDPIITLPPVSVFTNAGHPVTFSAAATGSAPLKYQWLKNGTNLPGATASSLALPAVSRTDVAAYNVVVTNKYGSATSAVANLSINLADIDVLAAGADDEVYAVVPQMDGKLVVGGRFTHLAGQSRSGLGRLNPDGSLDTNFVADVAGQVNAIAVQADGRILVGGSFTNLAGTAATSLARLNPDGSRDTNFVTTLDGGGAIICLALQADSRILAGGEFTSVNGSPHSDLVRLNADGSVDTNFVGSANGPVNALAVQSDGKIAAGGLFTSLNGQARWYIGRLNADGTLDANFNPGASSWVFSLALQPNGQLLAGGIFTVMGGQARSCIARLNADGSLDNNFNPSANDLVYSLGVHADGRILVGGNFTSLAGAARSYIARLNADGSLDTNFNPGADNVVYTLGAQSDGKVFLGGAFSSLVGGPATFVGRLLMTDPASASLSFTSTNIIWLRTGTAPGLSYVTFDAFTNGVAWVNLGPATYGTNGWELDGLSLPTNTLIRAHGMVSVGGTSAWAVESSNPSLTNLPPMIVVTDGMLGLANGQFGFNIAGTPGTPVSIQASSDLVNWTTVTNAVIGFAPFYFSDPSPADQPSRFYRLHKP